MAKIARANGADAGIGSLQEVTDVGNVTTNTVGVGSGNVPASGWSVYGDASYLIFKVGATNQLVLKAAATGVYAGQAGRGLGSTATPWRQIIANRPILGLVNIGDAGLACDGDEHYLIIHEPAAGSNDITLDAADVGTFLRVRVSVAAAGTVRLQTTGGDTINGVAAPFTLVGAPTTYTIMCESATDWCAEIE